LTHSFFIGVSSSGKTRAFGARIRRFESSHPSQKYEIIGIVKRRNKKIYYG
jgi:hypothetical protein